MKKRSSARCRAVALIEIIGALAIIAVLASLLLPKFFEALNNARLNQTLVGCETVKTATMQHFANFNSLASSNGVELVVTTSYDRFDAILLAEGLIDKLFSSRIGTNAQIRIVNVVGYTAQTQVDPRNGKGAYDLDGDGDNDIANARYVIEAAFYNVNEADATTLNKYWDGPGLGESGNSGQDHRGRMTYNKPHPQGRWGRDVHLYLTHR